jgi:ABC-2 type transport system ATP-binding protein
VTQAIVVEGLRKKFGQREVLHGLDFAVEPGTVFGVIGPNGAGKTTTMRCLLDIIRPSAGTISVLGQDPRHAGTALRRRIGYLPGELHLENRTTGRRMLEHFAAISGPVQPEYVNDLAERLDLDLDRQTRKLSKGNKQKLGLLQAFMHRPELLVLDEPTSGLDPLVQQEFHAMVREVVDDGATVFLSSHVLSEVQQAADAVAILRDGGIVTISTVEALRNAAVRQLRFNASGAAVNDVGALLARVPGVGNVVLRELPGDGAGEAAVEATATLSGQVQPLVQELARLKLTDLVLEEPDLEEAVLTLYTGHYVGNGNGHRSVNHTEAAHHA